VSATPSLHDLQIWLKWIITDPRGVTDALSDPSPKGERYQSRYTQPSKSYLEWIENSSIKSSTRLDIYAEAYFSRILECMEKDFSRTQKAVGKEAFTKLVAEYLKAFPSKFTSIDEVGSRFPGFISEFNDFPINEWVKELALFEWSWIEAFYAKNFSVDHQDWRDRIVSDEQMRFLVHPSVTLLKSRWPLAKLINAFDADKSIDPKDFREGDGCSLAIYRLGDEVTWDELDISLFQVLQNLKNQVPLEDAFSQIQDVSPDIISKTFSRWVERGILCGVLNESNEVKI